MNSFPLFLFLAIQRLGVQWFSGKGKCENKFLFPESLKRLRPLLRRSFYFPSPIDTKISLGVGGSKAVNECDYSLFGQAEAKPYSAVTPTQSEVNDFPQFEIKKA